MIKPCIPFMLALSLVVPAAPAMAGIPVVDIPQTARDMIHYIQQINHWVSTINHWKNQALEMQRAYDSTVGNRNIGALVNAVNDKEFRQYLPMDWDSALEVFDDVNGLVSELDAEIATLTTELKHMSAKNMYADPTSQYAKDYERRRMNAMASMSIARGVFNRGKTQIANIEKLLKAVDNAGNDQKAAIDLNSRISAEVALLNAQKLQVQATMAEQMAEMQNYWNEMDAKEARLSRDLNKFKYDF